MKTIKRLFFTVSILLFAGCDNVDIGLVTSAGVDAVKAVTLSAEQVQKLAETTSKYTDSRQQIAPPEHQLSKRLQKILMNARQDETLQFNYKVYLSKEVNAFAMADGTIRIYSGLMEMLNDEELLFVVGHEMGHVTLQHVHEKIRLAYAASAARKAVASIEGAIGDIARSQLGGLLQQIVNAQFSQHEEREADDYGLAFIKANKIDPQHAVRSLEKLATLGSTHTFLSSHPAPEKRAKRIAAQIEGKSLPEEEEIQGWFDKIKALGARTLQLLVIFLKWLISFLG